MHRLFWSFVVSFLFASTLPAQAKTVAERLGHPADSKLLILHADDLGAAHSIDVASFAGLENGAVTSASIMVPTPWITEVAAYARAHPNADLGLHLTLTSEWKTYRWGSVEPADKVASLLDSAGTFPNDEKLVAAHAKPIEAEREIRAQINRALALGIRPTHLDSHMGSLFTTPELIATYVKVAHDYHLPFLALKGSPLAAPQAHVHLAIGTAVKSGIAHHDVHRHNGEPSVDPLLERGPTVDDECDAPAGHRDSHERVGSMKASMLSRPQ